jgi:hypothetical protein
MKSKLLIYFVRTDATVVSISTVVRVSARVRLLATTLYQAVRRTYCIDCGLLVFHVLSPPFIWSRKYAALHEPALTRLLVDFVRSRAAVVLRAFFAGRVVLAVSALHDRMCRTKRADCRLFVFHVFSPPFVVGWWPKVSRSVRVC